MFMGNEFKNKLGVIDWNKTYYEAEKHMRQVGLKESAHTLIKDIGTGKQQLVEIAKAFAKKVRLLILDEPTSSLNDEDAKMLLDLLIEFKKQGLTSIIITHKLNEIIYCADKATILRDGSTIETLVKGVDEFSEQRIIKGMVGRPDGGPLPRTASTTFPTKSAWRSRTGPSTTRSIRSASWTTTSPSTYIRARSSASPACRAPDAPSSP